jgi:hypothetical protein
VRRYLAFQPEHSPRARKCSECPQKIWKGDPCLVARRGAKVLKVVCGESCRQTFEHALFSDLADRREERDDV